MGQAMGEPVMTTLVNCDLSKLEICDLNGNYAFWQNSVVFEQLLLVFLSRKMPRLEMLGLSQNKFTAAQTQ